jgi:hypothetical protein
MVSDHDKQRLQQLVHSNAAPAADDFWWVELCPMGFVKSPDGCSKCTKDTYSLNPSNYSCDICPAHATCPGQDVLLPAPGYWHSSKHSTKFLRCPESGVCAVKDPVINTTAECAEGHQGNLCGECSNGWGLKAPFRCVRCIGKESSVALYVTAAAAMLAFAALMWHLTLEDNVRDTQEVEPEDILKIMTVYAQTLAILSRAKVVWPTLLTGLVTPFTWAFTGGTAVVPLSCLVPPTDQLAVPQPILLLLLQLLLPVGLVLVVMLMYWLVKGVTRVWWKCRQPPAAGPVAPFKDPLRLPTIGGHSTAQMAPTHKFLVLWLVAVFLFYPTLVRAAFSLFTCHTLDVPLPDKYAQFSVATAARGYWEGDMSQACYQDWHLGWAMGLGVPLALLLVVGWPAFLLSKLLRNRTRMSDPEFRTRYGFIYRAFRPSRAWWGALVPLQLSVLVGVSTFMNVLGAYYCTLLLSILFGLMQCLALLFRPFVHSELNWLMMATVACLWLTSNGTLAFMDGPEGYDMSDAGRNVIGVLMLLVNLGVLSAALYLLVKHSWPKVKSSWQMVKAWWYAWRHGASRRRQRKGLRHDPSWSDILQTKAVMVPGPEVNPAEVGQGPAVDGGATTKRGAQTAAADAATAVTGASVGPPSPEELHLHTPQGGRRLLGGSSANTSGPGAGMGAKDVEVALGGSPGVTAGVQETKWYRPQQMHTSKVTGGVAGGPPATAVLRGTSATVYGWKPGSAQQPQASPTRAGSSSSSMTSKWPTPGRGLSLPATSSWSSTQLAPTTSSRTQGSSSGTPVTSACMAAPPESTDRGSPWWDGDEILPAAGGTGVGKPAAGTAGGECWVVPAEEQPTSEDAGSPWLDAQVSSAGADAEIGGLAPPTAAELLAGPTSSDAGSPWVQGNM